MKAEIDELKQQNTWVLTDLPSNKNTLKGKWVYKYKTNEDNKIIKYKARWVIKGYDQRLGIDYIETFSTMCRPETLKIIILNAVMRGHKIYQYDVKNAFVHAPIDIEIYVEQPTGFKENNNKVCKLLKALYGLKQSPRLWYKHLKNIFKQLGFEMFQYDEAVFIHIQYKIQIVCHVDDMIVTGPNKQNIDNIMNEVGKQLKIKYIGELTQFLGVEYKIDYINKTIFAYQTKYTNNIKNRFNKQHLTPVSTPVELGVQLIKTTEQADAKDILIYQQEVGSLLYLAIKTRPDISYAINRCARFMSNPNKTHFRAFDRIWKYLNHKDIGIYYNCNNHNTLNLLGYSDADWGGDTITRRSTSGYTSFINNNLISWNSTLQKTVALSTCEAEYMAMKEAIKEMIYLNNIIKYINNLYNNNNMIQKPPLIFIDNDSSIKLGENPEFHKRSKHIDIIYHFTRECVEEKKITLGYIPTREQLADGFTKGLNITKHKLFLEGIKMKPI